jgi:hypothetical protein
MINKRSALLGLVAAAASAVLLADPATAQGTPSAAQVQATAKAPSSGTSFGVADRPIQLIGHRRHHRRRHFRHRRHHFRHHRRHHRRHWGHWGGHSNMNSNRNTNTNTNVNINRNVIDIDP